MKAYIKGLSFYLPEKVLTNEQLVAEFPEWTVEKVAKKVGVAQRHIAGEYETASDMAVEAAEKLFSDYGLDRSKIDFVLLCTQSPDYFLPTTACLIQNRLKLPTSCGALDFNLGCSGYVYGLSLAKGLIFSGVAKNVLLLTSETYSKYIHPQDKGNKTIFGDAATATLISTDGAAEIGEFSLGTDGRGAENLIVRSGGHRHREVLSSSKEYGPFPDHLYMNGSEVFTFTMEAVPSMLEAVLTKNDLSADQIDLYVFHQANRFMLDTLRTLCHIELERFAYCMEDVGNTVSSTIPIALKRVEVDSKIAPGSKVLLAGFGVGYSWGACVLQY